MGVLLKYRTKTGSTIMKASDISDSDVLTFLAKHQGRWSTHGIGHSMPTVQDAMPHGTPVKVQLAKMRALYKRGYVSGCPCGCRGDWEITDEGLNHIGQVRTARFTGYFNG